MAIAPDFDETLAGAMRRTRTAARAVIKSWSRRWSMRSGAARRAPSARSQRSCAGAATALKVPDARGAVAIAGFGRDAVPDVPFLAIASEGDGAVPLKFVRERFPADVKKH